MSAVAKAERRLQDAPLGGEDGAAYVGADITDAIKIVSVSFEPAIAIVVILY